ncbi:hypothetical protein QKW60_03840 [Defluviimonas aestuarii]|uniref:hypothetical protein n=1 Tax=Albidovulum aestuarii TaxID=1130726 RepID=UPI00249BBCE4|nr:hypothetical protein [Defluviimonas aestuarii]MDI3335529.1 hypothetical protein [Defluviimonas aestuarii]
MRSVTLLCVLLPVVLSGCAALPKRDRAAATQADWPVLLTIEDLTAPPPAEADPTEALEARAAALRARAALLAATDI